MYTILPDLLKAYYVSISVALVVGIVLGIGIGRMLFERESRKRVKPSYQYDVLDEAHLILEEIEESRQA